MDASSVAARKCLFLPIPTSAQQTDMWLSALRIFGNKEDSLGSAEYAPEVICALTYLLSSSVFKEYCEDNEL